MLLNVMRLSAVWRAACACATILSLVYTTEAMGQINAYEGEQWPEETGWTRAAFCDPPRALIDGWFQQEVAPCPGDPLPGGQQESFRRTLAQYTEVDSFFLEWRVQTSGPRSEIIGVAPASMVAAGNFGTNYHVTIARDQVRLIRDNLLPIVYAVIASDVPHTYRIELHGAETYTWYIDGGIVDTGVPEGSFPVNDSGVISFRANCWFEPSITRWDYIRYGVIPEDASGDYNGDGAVTLGDFYIFHECLSSNRIGLDGGPANDAGPGCRFADYDYDADVDFLDFAEFQRAFGGID